MVVLTLAKQRRIPLNEMFQKLLKQVVYHFLLEDYGLFFATVVILTRAHHSHLLDCFSTLYFPFFMHINMFGIICPFNCNAHVSLQTYNLFYVI